MNDQNMNSIMLSLAVAVSLAACGGGGGKSSTVDPDTVLNGYVLDGPLVGAKVCLDTNSNWVCDVGEPSATSTANGAFSLSIAPLKYQDTYNKQIIAEVGPDALDEATGMTLHASGQGGYVLSSGGSQKPVLSPINTLLALQALSSGYSPNLDSVSVSDLLDQSGLSKTSKQYFDASSSLTDDERAKAKSTGRILASLLASARSKLKTDASAVYSTDSSQLGARTGELVVQTLRNTRPASTTETEAESLQRMQTALAAIAVTGSAEGLEHRTATAMSADAALQLMNHGLFEAGSLGSSPRAFQKYQSATSTGILSTQRYRYIGGQWGQDTSYSGVGSNGYHLIYEYTQANQTKNFRKIDAVAPSLMMDGSTLKEKFSDANDAQANELTVLSRRVGGLSFDAIPALASFSGTFAQDQSAYLLRRKALANQYLFDSVATFFTTLAQFKNSPQTCYEGICWSITQQANGNGPEQAGRMTFRTTSSGGSLSLGEGRFVEDTVAGINVLRMISIPIEVQNRSQLWSAKDGQYLSFADIDGKLWSGKYMASGAIWYGSYLLNLSGLNAVITSAQLNPYVQ